MADAIGTFETKHTGNTYSRTAEGHLVINAHFEGAGTGFDAVFGTLTLTQELSLKQVPPVEHALGLANHSRQMGQR